MKSKTILPILLLGIIFSATAFQASLQPQQKKANATSSAKYTVQIQNQDAVNHTYGISLLSPKSSWFYYPSAVKTPSNSQEKFNVTISPVKNALQQRYRFDMQIREQETGDIKELTGFFRVEQPYRLQITDIDKNRQKFRPGEIAETHIKIKNLDNRPVDDYRVEATYGNSTDSKTGTSILPGGERLYNFKFRIDEEARPEKQYINYTVKIGEKTARKTSHFIEISRTENISINSSAQNKILSYSETKSARNKGNSQTESSITAEIPSYLESITSTTPQPDKIQELDGKTVYVWNTKLEPGQKQAASYTVKYWIPLAGLLLLVTGIVTIKKLGRPIQLEKTAEKKEEEIKIKIEIQNNGEKTFENLELEEFIPDIAEVKENFNMNTPKIRKTSEGTKMTWKIQDLQPGDQRIIQYKIEPKLQVEEKVELQPATITDGDGEQKAESKETKVEFTPDTT